MKNIQDKIVVFVIKINKEIVNGINIKKFIDEYDHEMQVTHWMDTPKIKFDIKYIMDEKK